MTAANVMLLNNQHFYFASVLTQPLRLDQTQTVYVRKVAAPQMTPPTCYYTIFFFQLALTKLYLLLTTKCCFETVVVSMKDDSLVLLHHGSF